MKIFIGTEPRQYIPAQVLKYSLISRSSIPLEIYEMENLDLGVDQKMSTGFSIYRFHAPALSGYSGRALSLDADIVCLADIAELANMAMVKPAMARRRDVKSFATSVLLMDCQRLPHWDVKKWAPKLSNKTIYNATMWGMTGGFTADDLGELDKKWNNLDGYDADTKMIHYTSLPRQPWILRGHPFAWIFLRELKRAIAACHISKDNVLAGEKAGHLYTGLLADALAQKD